VVALCGSHARRSANDRATVAADNLVSAPNTIQYVYGIVRATPESAGMPEGIAGAQVRAVRSGRVAALTSALDAEEYAPALIEERVGDLQWLAPRAEAHDAVLSWAGDPGPVVPLHMWSLFNDEQSVREMLERRADEFATVLSRLEGADEYGLRVYADAAVLEKVAADNDADVGALERSAAAAGPGERYLIERKLERARRDAARTVAAATADQVFDALAGGAVAAVRDEIPNRGAEEASAVLSAAFLVRRNDIAAFRAGLTALVRELERRAFRFSFTGPWPPYHFTAVQAE
jgi:hypothetical protein